MNPEDQRRFVRPINGDGHGGAQCDIGAVEFGGAGVFLSKNGESPGAENHREHSMCYYVERAAGEPKHAKVRNIRVANRLDGAQVNTIREEQLCVPSTRTP